MGMDNMEGGCVQKKAAQMRVELLDKPLSLAVSIYRSNHLLDIDDFPKRMGDDIPDE